MDPVSFAIVGRTFSFDASGNQLGWTNDKNATYRAITWDDANRVQAIDDKGQDSTYSYDDQGQRVIKQSSQNLTVYVNQYFTERNGSIGTKNIFVGNTRVLSKVTGGTSFIRSYDGVTGAKQTPPPQANGSSKANNGKAVAKGQSDNGKHLGQEKNADKAGNGKGKANGKSQGNSGKRQAKANSPNTSNGAGGSKTAGVNGIEHRSDRANEVAQNSCKNKHLRDLYCDSNGDGIPDSQEGSGTDTGNGSAVVMIGSQGEQLFYYHSDHLGSTGYVTRENGKLHEQIQYFPFGETWVQQGGNTEKDPYLFTAKELDEETGLYYYGARYYDPRTSVWQSADPIIWDYLNGAHGQGVYRPANLGLYTYSYNSPVVYNDPDGRCPMCITGLIGAAIGGVIGAGIEGWHQVATGNYDLASMGAAAAGGAVAGGLAGATMGMSLIAEGGAAAAVGVTAVSSAAGGSTTRALMGEEVNAKTVVTDATVGVITHGILKGAGKVVPKSGNKFWTNSTTFKGNKVYQRNDLIDPKKVDARGRTNLERMQKGLAPIGPDGKSINLHHMTQSQGGAIAEMTQTFHQANSKVIHINPNSIPSGIDRGAFNKWRADYWKSRANDF